jgi:mRNA interferase RelE/StbE
VKKYTVLLSKSAGKFLRNVPLKILGAIQEKIEALADNPHPYYSQLLVRFKGLYKIRVGEYRIIYTVKNDQLEVLIIDIEHRSKVYKKL